MFYIPISKPIEKEEIDYEIPPYVIGAFLANGCCVNHARLTLSTGNEDVPQTICSFIKNLKYKEGYNNYKWQFYFEENDNRNFLMTKKFFNMFKNEICQYSHNKRIPDIYKNGSIKQRLELLQGLFDGDGSITQKGGTVTYSSVSKQLIDDIREVLWSLGYCSKLYKLNRPKIYKHDSYYISVNIPNYEKEKLFLIKRKKDIALKFKNIKQKKDFDRTSIRSIEKMNYKEDMTCFYVDNEEHLFLMNDYIVTHNTRVLTERVRRLLLDGVEPSNMVIISFTRMAAEELKERLIDVPGIGDCFVGTIHAFANKIFQNSNETYKLYSDEIENQFMTVLVNLYSKHITMDKFFIYKDIMKKIDLGLKTEIDLNAALTQNEIYEIEVFIGKIENDEYPETVKTLCKKHNVITFDELLKKTTEYFKEINGKVEYLFVDEFQDIGKLEKNFFEALNADNYFYVRRRETTEFIALNGGNVNYFLNLMKSHKWKTYYLNNNYRCGQEIIDISNKVIQQADDIINTKTICMSNKEGSYKIDSKYKIDQYLEYIKAKENYVDWFVLTRTNKDIAKLEILLSALNIPYVSFKKGEMTLEEMRKFMAENKVKLLTVHTSKGLESKNVLLYGNFPIKQKPYLRNNDEIKIQYVGMTRAMEKLIILN